MDLRPLGEEILELVNAGVSGIVMKDSSFDECVATVRAVAGGERILPPMTDTLVAHIAKEPSERKAQDVLEDVRMTPTELEVIELVGEGLSNKEIAQRLDQQTLKGMDDLGTSGLPVAGDSILATRPVRRAPPSVSLLMRGRTGATQHAPNLTSEMTADLGRFPGSFAFLFLRSSIECAE